MSLALDTFLAAFSGSRPRFLHDLIVMYRLEVGAVCSFLFLTGNQIQASPMLSTLPDPLYDLLCYCSAPVTKI